jgi:peptide methionine sulfoxide reductase msrA/msrB
MEYNELSPAESRIIEHKGTELAYSGEYDSLFRPGIYLCRRCEFPLYQADAKFDSGCGWPSFDEELPGAVKRSPDTDGQRTEISCANCGAHLGHVFTGENLTSKDTRHCVNSLSMKFMPEEFMSEEENYAVLGGGCFWCLDAIFRATKGIKQVIAGYAGGQSLKPTYKDIDGHAEVIRVVFDRLLINYRQILEIFFSVHNPTTKDRQGNDVGAQYRSIILYATLSQKRATQELIAALVENEVFDAPILTEIRPLISFHTAEDYHQDYYCQNPHQGYCQLVINPKLDKFRKKFPGLLAG